MQARRRAPSLIGLDVAHGSTASKLKTLGVLLGFHSLEFSLLSVLDLAYYCYYDYDGDDYYYHRCSCEC